MSSATALKRAQLADHIQKRFGISWVDVGGVSRKPRVTYCRQRAAFVLRDNGMTVVEVGEKLNRDHSTISHGTRKLGLLAKYDTQVAEDVAVAVSAMAGVTRQ